MANRRRQNPTEPHAPIPVRRTIYTRKSTEEGLDQAFNSLDAQREAAEAYNADRTSKCGMRSCVSDAPRPSADEQFCGRA
jgi:hypothetical protein